MDWCGQLKKRADEVLETLKSEGTLSEACFVSQDGESIYYFMEIENLENSNHKIDKDHRDARDSSLEKIEELTALFYFQNK